MLESNCRKCASCCHNCIFLSYDKTQDLFSCLIYNNKNRQPIIYAKSPDSLDRYLGHNPTRNHFLKLISEIFKGSNKICDRFICTDSDGHRWIHNEQEKWIKRHGYKSRKEYFIECIKDCEEVTSKIPDFTTLVEILNAT